MRCGGLCEGEAAVPAQASQKGACGANRCDSTWQDRHLKAMAEGGRITHLMKNWMLVSRGRPKGSYSPHLRCSFLPPRVAQGQALTTSCVLSLKVFGLNRW